MVKGRKVALAWFSPDCKHFSKAKGGKPVKKNIRDLAWVVVHWAKLVRPAVIMLENVEEFTTWGPLTAAGMPCPDRKGQTFARWCASLRKLGYRLEWKYLRACDYGAPTIRKRLFLIARCDGQPIVWPAPTHGPGLLPYRTAAQCIDWSLPCPSIFLTRAEGRAIGVNRPLAEATMARIAKGVQKYVINAAEPFFVTYGQQGGSCRSADEPFHTVTASPKDTNQLVTAFLAQHNTGVTGRAADAPLSTITQTGTQQAIVAAHMLHMKGSAQSARGCDEPLAAITAQGTHHAEVRAFLMKYYGNEKEGHDLAAPMGTVTTKDRFGLVMVHGEPYQIVDIGMRMLSPRELFRAQGFPDSYIIDPIHNGKRLTKTSQVAKVGNSVSPVMARALVGANLRAEPFTAREAA